MLDLTVAINVVIFIFKAGCCGYASQAGLVDVQQLPSIGKEEYQPVKNASFSYFSKIDMKPKNLDNEEEEKD